MTREEAIELLKEEQKSVARVHSNSGEFKKTPLEETMYGALDMAIEALRQERRRKGKWIYNETKHRYKCSLCTMENYENSNYCPYCGADMREE